MTCQCIIGNDASLVTLPVNTCEAHGDNATSISPIRQPKGTGLVTVSPNIEIRMQGPTVGVETVFVDRAVWDAALAVIEAARELICDLGTDSKGYCFNCGDFGLCDNKGLNLALVEWDRVQGEG